jgi:hypothetical protein
MIRPYEDVTGEKFGRLEAIRRVPRKNDSKRFDWECKCDCGNTSRVKLSDLKRGKVLSCGCLNRENTFKRNKKYNAVTIKNGVVEVTLFNSDSVMLCDEEEWDKYKNTCWRVNRYGYAVGTVDGKLNIPFHKLVLNSNDKYIDHINRNKLDNRKCNLRIATAQMNAINQGCSSRNTSGVKGVYLNKRTQKWVASIAINKKTIHLGTFETIENAIRARKEAENKYHKPLFGKTT